MNKNIKGMALILVLGILSVLSVIGISFTMLVTVEDRIVNTFLLLI